MKVLFISKASTKTGLGHLIRSRSLANRFLLQDPTIDLHYKVIGEQLVSKLLTEVKYAFDIYDNEEQCIIEEDYDLSIMDMTHISDNLFNRIADKSRLKVCISPIFNKMNQIDIFFNRTKYHKFDEANLPSKIYASLDCTIIQDDCKKIKTSIYEDNLELKQFPIAISMGGGDAANKTLNFLKSLKTCKVPATFWVMLGEGYKHSYDKLISEIKKDSGHEIILAKANRSMWQILKNCILAILPGGITTYEAAYAGLPTLNLLENEESYFLIRELEEKNVCLYNGIINQENLSSLNTTIEKLYYDRKSLLQMHINSKNLIPEDTGSKILEKCKEMLRENTTLKEGQ